MTALSKMGGYLRSLKSFQVEAVTSREDVLEDGQKVQFSGCDEDAGQDARPALRRCEKRSADREFFYDGKNFTVLAKRANITPLSPRRRPSAPSPTPSTSGTASSCRSKTCSAGAGPNRKNDAITSAMFVGPSEIDGVTCGHYAFRQEGLDWQVWIQRATIRCRASWC